MRDNRKSYYQLAGKKTDTITLLHLTDSHLFADKQAQLLTVPTWYHYQAVVNDMLPFAAQADLLVATGDLSQDGSLASYQWFAEQIQHLHLPCAWLAGNHDDPSQMHLALPAAGLPYYRHWLLGEHWQLCLLDSRVAGCAHGLLAAEQYQWLVACLQQYPQRFMIVALHHHPLTIGSAWLDQHNLHNAAEFAEQIGQYPQVKVILCGHIHQQWQQPWEQGQVIATPATCFQFLPLSSQFALDKQAPGWRRLVLHQDGQVSSDVFRLDHLELVINQQAAGY